MTNFQSLIEQNRNGEAIALPCFCTANEIVLRTIFRYCAPLDVPVIIEASSNQVNQYAGYTGITPVEFARWVHILAEEHGVLASRVILAGGHLGIQLWHQLAPKDAMDRAQTLVRDYAAAGFHKFHINTSASCVGESSLDIDTIAARTAQLCSIVEKHSPHPNEVVFVLNAPVPEQVKEPAGKSPLPTTPVEQLVECIAAYEKAFIKQGLRQAWARVVSIATQPGTGYSHDTIHPIDANAVAHLSGEIKKHEGLSLGTFADYQPASTLKALVEHNFFFLNVGPELTFSMREALFALSTIESQMLNTSTSGLFESLDAAMREHPEFWESHYSGDADTVRHLQHFSFNDRIRYYWNYPQVRSGLVKFLAKLDKLHLPESLVSQYFPSREFGNLDAPASELVHSSIEQTVSRFYKSCGY